MKEALLYTKHKDNKIKCNLCAHYCELKENQYGICGVRQNIEGKLFSLNYGLLQGLALDPVEKKPFYHFIPGTKVLSFGLPGCNFRCANCQNSYLSQNIKKQRNSWLNAETVSPALLIEYAIKHDIAGIAYTYSEPTIFFEYAYDVILESRRHSGTANLKQMFISNGFFSKELREKIFAEKLLDAVNIDLKFIDDKKYKKITGGSLTPVLENIEAFAGSNIHLEIINLVIPGENDSNEDFKKIARFLSSLGKDIPLHFNRFFPYHEMQDKPPTPIERLISAKRIAEEYGMQYVYIGNAAIENASDTFCPECGALLIKRNGYSLSFENIRQNCGSALNFK